MRALLIVMATLQLSQVAGAFREAWRPRPRIARSAWCEENLRLPGDYSTDPGGFSVADREYQREILDAVDDPSVRQIVFVAAPQIGKTEVARAVVASQGEVDAAPMMFAGPDQLYIREQRDQIYRNCEVTPALRRRVPPERERNDRWIDLQRCRVFLAWSGSSQRLSGRSCKIVLASECDRWQLSPELAEKRTRAFWRSCVMYEGSPVGDSPVLYGMYRQSDRRTYRIPCPLCGHHQELRFFPHRQDPFAGKGGVAGLQRPDGSWKTPEEARRDAYYVCESCGGRIESRQKAAMVARGVWCPEGCEVLDGKVTGKPSHPGRRRGYRLSALYAPTVSFGDAAEAYLRLRDTTQGMQTFWNDWLGLAYTPRGKTPQWKELGLRLAGVTRRGQVPVWAFFLTAGVDVQADRVYWIVRAWGDGCTSALIDWGCFHRVETEAAGTVLSSDLAQLDAVLAHRWPVVGENPRGLSALAACRLGIDTGYRPTDVFAWVRAHPGERVLAVAGDPKIVPGVLYRLARLEKNVRTGKAYPEGTTRWGIDTSAYKSDLQDRWHADRGAPGVWWLPADVLQSKDGEDYLRQITNERRVQEAARGKNLQVGAKTTRWEVISEATGNHYWDCEVYARALADMVVGQIWDASQWSWGVPTPKTSESAEIAARETNENFSAR
ncbi:MAG: terminase gpA endonuclease subunit [Phycisphaerae bacterium]